MDSYETTATRTVSPLGTPLVVLLDRPFRLAGWQIDPVANEITKGDRTARLEPKAMRLLACLAGRAERPVTREALSAAIWPDVIVGEDSLSRLVFQLRRAFGDDPRHPRFIETLPKVGYRLAVAVQPAATATAMATAESPATVTRAAKTQRTLGEGVFERAPSSSVLLAMAVLGCAFSGGWWSGRVTAHRHRVGASKRKADRMH